MDLLKVYLFNTPRFEYQGTFLEVPRRKSVALAAYLAMSQQPQSRDIVSTVFWPELNQEKARGALRSAMYSLTKLFSEKCFVATRNTILLNENYVWVDVREFLELIAQCRLHSHDANTVCADCILLLKQAVDLYQGDFLSGFALNDSLAFDDWQGFQQEFLRRECGENLRRLAEYYADKMRDEFDLALHYARRWLLINPLHEPAHRLLMRLLATSGQHAKAIQQYHKCVNLLDEQLATIPEPETTALFEEIRTKPQSVSRQASPRVPNSVLPPLPALVIGREKALNDLKQRLGASEIEKRQPVVVVQGWPGVGKSTLIAALAHEPEMNHAFSDGILWTSLG